MTDSAIIKLLFDRDDLAVVELESKYGKLMKSYACRYLNDSRDAEEIYNDTIADIWKSIPPDHPNRLGAYITAILKRKVINRLRYLAREKRSRTGEALFCDFDDVVNVAGTQRSAEDVVIDDKRRLLSEFLKSEPSASRIIFVKRYYYGKSISEITRETGMSETAVSSRLSRTKARLYRHLTEKGVLS